VLHPPAYLLHSLVCLCRTTFHGSDSHGPQRPRSLAGQRAAVAKCSSPVGCCDFYLSPATENRQSTGALPAWGLSAGLELSGDGGVVVRAADSTPPTSLRSRRVCCVRRNSTATRATSGSDTSRPATVRKTQDSTDHARLRPNDHSCHHLAPPRCDTAIHRFHTTIIL
jgi:hypothetical protein